MQGVVHALDRLGLIAALHREADLAGALDVVAELRSLFDEVAEAYFLEDGFLSGCIPFEQRRDYYCMAVDAVTKAPRPRIVVSVGRELDSPIIPISSTN